MQVVIRLAVERIDQWRCQTQQKNEPRPDAETLEMDVRESISALLCDLASNSSALAIATLKLCIERLARQCETLRKAPSAAFAHYQQMENSFFLFATAEYILETWSCRKTNWHQRESIEESVER
jgi:hypothetical protein